MVRKTEQEKQQLANAKAKWCKKMRNYYGNSWIKRTASRIHKDGRRRMNVPHETTN